MRPQKRILCPERMRRVPESFSWIDHRLVRDGHLGGLGHEAQGLYLFLVTVSDAEGLSYYSDAKAAGLLSMSAPALAAARRELQRADLIAYRHPLYQVLSLPGPGVGIRSQHGRGSPRGAGEAVPIGELLTEVFGGGQ